MYCFEIIVTFTQIWVLILEKYSKIIGVLVLDQSNANNLILVWARLVLLEHFNMF